MKVGAEESQDLERALSLEWLETNGRGGFSSGTVAGANTRRYHALLLIARTPPGERFVLVNQLEEWLELGGQSFSLSTNCYPGTIHPRGYERCVSFSTDPWPTWRFNCGGATIQREILVVRGRDLVIVRWTLHGTNDQRAVLRMRPKLTGRDSHATHHENESLSTKASIGTGTVTWQPYPNLPRVRVFHAGEYRHAPEWYRQVEFPMERLRGLDYAEDWWSPGVLTIDLESGTTESLAFTSEPIDSLDIPALTEQEGTRREQWAQNAPTADSLTRTLWLATDTYLSCRGDRQTVIAGYPWFTDWGRDTFISLPGLCLVTGRFNIAWQIIEAFAAYLSDGMIPNRFPGDGEQPEYNTIDASLWFIHAIDRYLALSQDESRVRTTAWPAIRQILDGYRRGTRYDIRMDRDGLIVGGGPGAQLTWMDAKVDEQVITPRHGKPVEIQALWVRALEIGEQLARRFNDNAYADHCRADRQRAVASFHQRFWYEHGGYFYDVIDGPEGNDTSLRPNQLFAISLVDDLVPRERAQQILRQVKEQLFTPVGLRTLPSADPRYHAHYEGGIRERDSAYHQGTVWPFLLGPMVTAWIKSFGRTATARKEARGLLNGLDAHLGEACLGQVSEIFDAEAPHAPRGCVAQAWSVAEPLRALIEDLGFSEKSTRHPIKPIIVRRRKSSGDTALRRTRRTD